LIKPFFSHILSRSRTIKQNASSSFGSSSYEVQSSLMLLELFFFKRSPSSSLSESHVLGASLADHLV